MAMAGAMSFQLSFTRFKKELPGAPAEKSSSIGFGPLSTTGISSSADAVPASRTGMSR